MSTESSAGDAPLQSWSSSPSDKGRDRLRTRAGGSGGRGLPSLSQLILPGAHTAAVLRRELTARPSTCRWLCRGGGRRAGPPVATRPGVPFVGPLGAGDCACRGGTMGELGQGRVSKHAGRAGFFLGLLVGSLVTQSPMHPSVLLKDSTGAEPGMSQVKHPGVCPEEPWACGEAPKRKRQ